VQAKLNALGILVPFLDGTINAAETSFALHNEALKRRIEESIVVGNNRLSARSGVVFACVVENVRLAVLSRPPAASATQGAQRDNAQHGD